MRTRIPNLGVFSWALFILVLGFTIAHHHHQAGVALTLEGQGSPAPQIDTYSSTGYEKGLRHFLGTRERGETYRWIIAVQRARQDGFQRERVETLDQSPEPRRTYSPSPYLGWLALQSRLIEATTNLSAGAATEHVAWLDPLLAHLAALTGWFLFSRRVTPPLVQVAGLLLVWLLPGWGEQFISGVLSPRPWAILLGASGLYCFLTPTGRTSRGRSLLSAFCLAGAGWLDPAMGLPWLILTATVGVSDRNGLLLWSLAGMATTCVGAWLDGVPLDPRLTEFKYIHYLNTTLWLALLGWQSGRGAARQGLSPRTVWIAWGAAGLCLLPLAIMGPIAHLPGWWAQQPAQLRLSSLDDTVASAHLWAWSRSETLAVSLPWCLLWLAVVALCGCELNARWRSRQDDRPFAGNPWLWPCLGLLLLAAFRIRWLPMVATTGLAMLAFRLPAFTARTRQVAVGGVVALALIGLGGRLRVDSVTFFATPELQAADVEALAYRQFAHWLSRRIDPGVAVVLAPPETSDSLNFHGGVRTVLSTAWETYAGQVAASRILSAPEDTEVEAVMQSRQITHIALPSWDPVFPLWVRRLDSPLGEPFYDRVKKWIFPSFLRPVPYHLPGAEVFREQKLALFAVTPPQDEALQLSRLAEYFLEMQRLEPAGLVVKVLRETFPRDANASLARALDARQRAESRLFQRELKLVVDEVKGGREPEEWDRRVQRAIVLALGGQHDLARPEIEACLATLDETALRSLSPLESFRLQQLSEGYRLPFREARLQALLQQQAAELAPAR